MESYTIIKGTIYLLVTSFGIVGNALILLSFGLIAHQDHQLGRSEIILSHVAAANLVMYLTRTLPTIFYEYGWKNLFGDVSCKMVSGIFRVFRGMAIGLSCLFSCFQYTIISKTSTAEKQKIQSCVTPVIAVLYMTNMVMNVDAIILATKPYNASNLRNAFKPGFCLVVYPDKLTFEANGFSKFAFDLLFVVPVALASARILLILHRHRKKMKAVRSTDQNQGRAAETQAAKNVSLLVSFYITFYGIDNTIFLYQTFFNDINVVVSDIRVFFTMCHGAVFLAILSIFSNKIKNLLLKLLSNKAGGQ